MKPLTMLQHAKHRRIATHPYITRNLQKQKTRIAAGFRSKVTVKLTSQTVDQL